MLQESTLPPATAIPRGGAQGMRPKLLVTLCSVDMHL